MNLMLAAVLQLSPESISWWLPKGPLRDALWLVVVSLNLAVLLWILWKLLFAGKGWTIPKFLRGRTQSIREELDAAERAFKEAEGRLAAIEARIAHLPEEAAALKAEAEREATAEYQRILDESRQEGERLLRTGQQEIASATKLAQSELKKLAAHLAVNIARQRIEERLTVAMDEAVVAGAVAGMNAAGSTRPN